MYIKLNVGMELGHSTQNSRPTLDQITEIDLHLVAHNEILALYGARNIRNYG